MDTGQPSPSLRAEMGRWESEVLGGWSGRERLVSERSNLGPELPEKEARCGGGREGPSLHLDEALL